MDELQERIARLKLLIRQTKSMQSELNKSLAEFKAQLREVMAQLPKKPKSRKSN